MDLVMRQRKFTLAMFFACCGSVGLFTGYLGGGEYVALASLIMAAYGASNVMDKKDV